MKNSIEIRKNGHSLEELTKDFMYWVVKNIKKKDEIIWYVFNEVYLNKKLEGYELILSPNSELKGVAVRIKDGDKFEIELDKTNKYYSRITLDKYKPYKQDIKDRGIIY